MFVVTADQQSSTLRGDRVPHALAALAERGLAAGGPKSRAAESLAVGVRHGFARTVGDEIQALFTSAEAVAATLTTLNRLGEWSIGIGIGEVDVVGNNSASSSGPAYLAARDAVEAARAKGVPTPIVVRIAEALGSGSAARTQEHLQGLCQLHGSVERRRSDAGWEAADLLPGRTQAEVAEQLNISPAAVSQRLRNAQWYETQAASGLLLSLLTRADAIVARKQ